jgi:D-inositol-3-phosphate glycosyltransferase
VIAGDGARAAGPRPTLIAIGAWLPQSGFTRVLASVLSRLASTYDIHYIGMSYKGELIRTDGFTVHPCNLRGGDLFGAYQGRDLARERRAEAVLLLNDLWMLKNYMNALRPLRDELGTRIVAYCPLDGRLPDPSMMEPFDAVDRFVAYTEFGRREFSAAVTQLNAAGAAGARFPFDRIDVIPHGVDVEAFSPLGSRRAVRRELFAGRADARELEDAFIVLNANRPAPRKRLDLTIDGFARFAQGKRDVRLYLHQAIQQPRDRGEIDLWIDRAGIRDRVIMPIALGDETITQDDRLNLIYNACDVGVNTAMGEGWGLVSVEHGATGAAQIVPRHSACEEIWDGSALMIDPIERFVPEEFSPLELAAVSAEQVADALEKLYRDVELRRKLSMAAFDVARRPEYSWARIGRQWEALLSEARQSEARQGEARHG